MINTNLVTLNLVCPYCDEEMHRVPYSKTIGAGQRQYVLLECVMGHRAYGIIEVPENQADIVNELEELGYRSNV